MLWFKKKNTENILKMIYKKSKLKRYSQFLIGTLIVAVAFNILILPLNIIYGISGVGVIFKYIFSTDPSLVIFIGSLLLLILSFVLLGYEDTKHTILGSLLYPVFVKLTEPLITYVDLGNPDPLILTIFGALITGFGLGLIFKSGFTTGGTDILNAIVSKYFKMSLGNAMLLTDGAIILCGVFVFGWETVMYSLIALYIISIMTDKVVLGISQSKAFYIVTSEPENVKEFILKNISHGVTVIDARGGYTNDRQKMLLCVVPTSAYFKLKEGIHYIDESAFFVVTDAYETSGGSVND